MGLRATVMNETIINILTDRLEKQAGDIALLNEKLTKVQESSDKYYKWWSDEQDVTAKLEAKVKELEEESADLQARLGKAEMAAAGME
jgi:hypothetical protein